MITFIMLFFPAALSMWLYEHVTKTDLSVKRWVSLYAVHNLLINFVCLMLMRLVTDEAGEYIYNRDIDIPPYVATNYMIKAIPVAIVLGVVAVLLHKNVKVELESNEEANI